MSQRSHNRMLAQQAAARHGIDVRLFTRQMRQEAHFQDLTSGAGAQGPAQIMPETAAAWNVRNVHDPAEAYDAAAEHMAQYLHQYGGSWAKALTAYNAGPGAVGHPLPAETQHYIETVTGGSTAPTHAPKAVPITFGAGRLRGGRPPTMTPGGTSTDQKAAMLAALLDPRKNMSLLDRFHDQVRSGQFTTTTAPTVTPGQAPSFTPGAINPGKVDKPVAQGGGRLARIEAEANRIDAAHVPYLWGGGHAGKQPRGSKVTPLDCSGAVSRVLGINPRVASQFEKWGKPGRGKAITVWAKNDHVIVEIAGHFWGTSNANPGGGAGWIPRSQISASYLAQFTPRHPG